MLFPKFYYVFYKVRKLIDFKWIKCLKTSSVFKLFSSPYVWVVASMRSDFMSHLERFPKLIDLLNGGAEYKLSFPQQTEIGQIISRPAQEAGLSFEHNENGKYLNEFLQESASKEKSSLPLLEYLLNQLWEMRDSEKNQLTFKAYQELGGLEGAMGKKATEVYESLEIEEQKAMSRLIIMLASVAEEGEQKITAKKVNKNQIEKNPTIKACAKALLREDVRLLISSKDAEGNDYYRMAHEAIFSHWKLARESILEDKKDIQLRDKLEKDAQQWKDAKDGYKKAYLINDGLPLTLALDLLSRRESELEEKVVKFINSSKTRVQRGKFVVKTLWGTLLLISVLVSVFMYGLMEEANREREEVERVTEKLVAIISRYQKKGVEGIGVVKIDVEVFESIIKDFKKSTNNKILKNVEASYSMLCFFYSNEKEYEKSINACKQAIKLNPTNDNAYNNMGNTYNSKEEYDKAITAYQKAIKINPKSGAYFNLGLIYELKEEYSNAIEVYKKSIEIDPKRNKSYIRMGIMYYNMGNNFFTLKEYDKAIERYQKAVEVNPKLYSAYLNMGNTYSKKNIYDKAIKSYQKAMEINPEDDRVYSSLGIMYYNIGNEYTALKEYDKAIEEYQRAVEYFPEYYSTYFNMGNVYAQKKLYDKAIELYDKAIEMNPKEYKTYYSMGIVYDSTKKYDKAIKAYKKAIKINPNNSHVHHNIGMSYYHKKEYENAIKSYQISSVISKKLIKFNEDNSKLKIDLLKNYGMIGEVYKIQNRWNDALLEFMKFLPIMKKVLDKDPDNYKWRSIAYYTYSQMAISYRALNDEVNAKKFEIKSKLLDP